MRYLTVEEIVTLHGVVVSDTEVSWASEIVAPWKPRLPNLR